VHSGVMPHLAIRFSNELQAQRGHLVSPELQLLLARYRETRLSKAPPSLSIVPLISPFRIAGVLPPV
jgi:hypothetical protein